MRIIKENEITKEADIFQAELDALNTLKFIALKGDDSKLDYKLIDIIEEMVDFCIFVGVGDNLMASIGIDRIIKELKEIKPILDKWKNK